MGLAGGYPARENLREHLRLRMLASHCFSWVFQSLDEPEKHERRIEVMRIQKFVIGSVLALALLLFAQQRPGTTQPAGFREVVDLTHALSTNGFETPHKSGYRLETVALSEKTSPRGPPLRNNFLPGLMLPPAWDAASGQWIRFRPAA